MLHGSNKNCKRELQAKICKNSMLHDPRTTCMQLGPCAPFFAQKTSAAHHSEDFEGPLTAAVRMHGQNATRNPCFACRANSHNCRLTYM